MLRSSFRLLYIRTNHLVRLSSPSSSLSLFPSKFDSAKPRFNPHRIRSLPLSTTGAKLSRSEPSMAATSEPKSIYDFTVKVRFPVRLLERFCSSIDLKVVIWLGLISLNPVLYSENYVLMLGFENPIEPEF